MSNSGLFHPPEGEKDKHAYHSPLEKKVRQILTPFQNYIKAQVTASILLLTCTLIALIWASIPALSHWYDAFTKLSFGFHFENMIFEESLRFWVNDVLLTLFFFFVGLEIKREFLVGELTDHKRALLVLCSAFGGMLVPTAIYLIFNHNTPTQFGWGIPMATDTAFALGILACFRRKLPPGIFTFLAALAIIDDIGAILVVAIFYTQHINTLMLFLAMLLVLLLILINYAGFRKPFPYLLIGLLIWALVEAAGIHGTVAGILVAFLIPARPLRGPNQFIKKAKKLLLNFEKRKQTSQLVLEDPAQHAVLEDVQEIARQATTPLQRWESQLELPVALIILPLFALINAGIPINSHLINSVFTQRVSLGIFLGLVLGKPIGILLFTRMALWCRLGSLPTHTTFKHVISAAMLTGIGFTMSLFIANLSFATNMHVLVIAKAAILFGSIAAGIGGIVLLCFIRDAKPE